MVHEQSFGMQRLEGGVARVKPVTVKTVELMRVSEISRLHKSKRNVMGPCSCSGCKLRIFHFRRAIHANPSNFEVSQCLFFTDRIKQGSMFDVILSLVLLGEYVMSQHFG